mmetsp:Transcript_141079/g.263157  ORF Transcript_141079/g.263157 Transcript_141079/m.263157 type:complete len:123 (-) Transcript_141079:154-522(-)
MFSSCLAARAVDKFCLCFPSLEASKWYVRLMPGGTQKILQNYVRGQWQCQWLLYALVSSAAKFRLMAALERAASPQQSLALATVASQQEVPLRLAMVGLAAQLQEVASLGSLWACWQPKPSP